MKPIAKVALAIPFTSPYDYHLPPDLVLKAVPGARVLVSVGRRVMIGCVVHLCRDSAHEDLKDVLEIIDDKALFSEGALRLARWISEYYLVSLGEVLEASIPGGLKPKIVKAMHINQLEAKRQPPEVFQWLSLVDGKTEKSMHSDPMYPRFKNKLRQWVKAGVIEYQYTVAPAKTVSNAQKFLYLNPEVAPLLKTRQGSKADQIIRLLTLNENLPYRDVRTQVSNSSQIIRQLISKKALFQKELPVVTQKKREPISLEAFITLNERQQIAFDTIREALSMKVFRTLLLFGVTGSGKTEVYLHAVRETLAANRTVMILIPEISLTHQVVNRFRDRFGDRIAVLHSGMAEKERCGEWWKLKNKQCDIAIGARSAIFSPLENVGLIVVDEEHDNSYKQQESPFYNARDIAVKLGQEHNAVVILGSATPSVESFNNVRSGKYGQLDLPARANQKPLPPITVINLKEEKRQSGVFYLSKVLVSHLKENLEKGKQALVFLNRRGYAAFLSCQDCDLPVLCVNCSIALTWHRAEKRLICHHCGYKQLYAKQCPTCGGESLRLDGIGTERIERDLKLLFPSARFLRMDRDTVRRKGVLEKNIDSINNHEVDFIIGTQLISKGHDFKQVGLVCVILADIGLNIPDFRSSERSFQLLSQVSGRAGRDESGYGQVIAQTYNPGHFAIQTAVNNDVEGFVNQELETRGALENPPATKMILLKISDVNVNHVETTAVQLGSILVSKSVDLSYQVLGPIESPISRVNKRFYWQILIKADDMRPIKRYLRFLFWDQKEWRPVGSTRVSIDVDPFFLG